MDRQMGGWVSGLVEAVVAVCEQQVSTSPLGIVVVGRVDLCLYTSACLKHPPFVPLPLVSAHSLLLRPTPTTSLLP